MFTKDHYCLILLFLVSLTIHASATSTPPGVQSIETNKYPLSSLNPKLSREAHRRLASAKPKKCPDADDDIWQTWHGETVKKPCTKDCKVHWKLTDYLKEINNCRDDGKDCAKLCKTAVLDPLITGAPMPKGYSATSKPMKNCLMGNRIQVGGIDGAGFFLSFLKSKKKAAKLIIDPCQSYNNYKHAKYMASSSCIMHYEHYTGAKPSPPNTEKCDSSIKTKATLQDWRQRALRHGKFKSGIELVGVMDAKYGFNPKLFLCNLGLGDNDRKNFAQKNLFNRKWNNLGIGLFKKGDSVYYSVSLTDWASCRASVVSEILGKKKLSKAWELDKGSFKDFEGSNKDFKEKMEKEAKKSGKACAKAAKKAEKDKKKADKKKGGKKADKKKDDKKDDKKKDDKKDDKKKDDKKDDKKKDDKKDDKKKDDKKDDKKKDKKKDDGKKKKADADKKAADKKKKDDADKKKKDDADKKKKEDDKKADDKKKSDKKKKL